MPQPLLVPAVNGHFYSFASIEASIGVQKFVDFTEINYETSLEVGDVYGTTSMKLGTTRGKNNVTATVGMYIRAWERLRNLLSPAGVGYGHVMFPFHVMYAEIGSPVKLDELFGCRVTNTAYNNADGTEAGKVTLTLNVLRLFEDKTGTIALPPIGFGF